MIRGGHRVVFDANLYNVVIYIQLCELGEWTSTFQLPKKLPRDVKRLKYTKTCEPDSEVDGISETSRHPLPPEFEVGGPDYTLTPAHRVENGSSP